MSADVITRIMIMGVASLIGFVIGLIVFNKTKEWLINFKPSFKKQNFIGLTSSGISLIALYSLAAFFYYGLLFILSNNEL